MTIIIGLVGGAGSGKTTIGKYLVEHHGAVRYALADPLKQLLKRAFDLELEQLYGTQDQKEAVDPRYNVSARWLMQHVGTEGIRSVFGPDIWVNTLVKTLMDEQPKLAVVDDVRFKNEAVGLRKAYGAIWRVENPVRQSLVDMRHQSEAEWNSILCDAVIAPAEPGLPRLYELVDQLCERLRIQPRGV